MHLICGLGNPGIKYELTRHNVGFLVIDYILTQLSDRKDISITEKSEHKALTYRFKLGEADVILAKPQTFMNLSGESVRGLMAFYKIPLENILVIHDDVDQQFLSIKFQKNSNSGGQNGVKNIHELLGTQDYCRLKMGIGKPRHPNQATVDHVLQRFSDIEMQALPDWLGEVHAAIDTFIQAGYEKASNKYNFKSPGFSGVDEAELKNLLSDKKNLTFEKIKNALKKR